MVQCLESPYGEAAMGLGVNHPSLKAGHEERSISVVNEGEASPGQKKRVLSS